VAKKNQNRYKAEKRFKELEKKKKKEKKKEDKQMKNNEASELPAGTVDIEIE